MGVRALYALSLQPYVLGPLTMHAHVHVHMCMRMDI
jgi:hypothetical protein